MVDMAEHSVDLSLLKRDSRVLDLGCRGFQFSNELLNYVDEIYCVDADSSVTTNNPKIKMLNIAVGADNKLSRYVKFGNGSGNYLETNEPRPAECEVEYIVTWTLEKLCNYFGVYDWDLIKMDLEKSEVPIIKSLIRPPAKQLSIEWHLHCGSKKEEVEECFKKLEQWYTLGHCDYSDKHGCGFNYWSTCWLLK